MCMFSLFAQDGVGATGHGGGRRAIIARTGWYGAKCFEDTGKGLASASRTRNYWITFFFGSGGAGHSLRKNKILKLI